MAAGWGVELDQYAGVSAEGGVNGLVCDIENFAAGVDEEERRDQQDWPHLS